MTAILGACRGHIRASIGYFLILQSVLLIGYFTILPYLHTPTVQRDTKLESRSEAAENVSLDPLNLRNVIKKFSNISVAKREVVHRSHKTSNVKTGKRRAVITLAANDTSGDSSRVKKSKKSSHTTHAKKTKLKSKHALPPSKEVRSSLNTSYSYWVNRLQSSLENNTKFSVTHNLDEWFPLNLTRPSSLTIRGVKNIDDDPGRFYRKSSRNESHLCLKTGTKVSPTRTVSLNNSCSCKSRWRGPHCSVPDIVYYSSGADEISQITLRTTPRKVINAIAFNMEFDLLEARIHELWHVVDIFIIYESNYTLYGDRKPLRLFDMLLAGYLTEYHSKLYYLFLGKFPFESVKLDGWYAEEYARTFIGKEGMKHTLGLQPDDLFIYTDADEIPSHDAILFLKTHDGYPEPFGFSLRWSVFGFFWKQSSPTNIFAGCSVRMFRYIFSNNAQKLRVADYENINSDTIKSYIKSGGKLLKWTLGDGGIGNGGWHCSWCLTPEFIKVKLESAVNADFPRWGSFPAKLNLTYIRSLVKNGVWFDDSTQLNSLVTTRSDEFFAPKFMLDNWDRFSYVLDKAAAK